MTEVERETEGRMVYMHVHIRGGWRRQSGATIETGVKGLSVLSCEKQPHY